MEINNLLAYIQNNFFYDLKSSVISIFVIIGAIYFSLLLKDNGEKVAKSAKYLVGIIVCIVVVSVVSRA